MSYTYDPKTGKWTNNPNPPKKTTPSKTKPSKTTPSKNTSINKTTTNPSGNTTNNNTDSKTSQGSEEKKNNYIEINTLEGTLTYIVTKETIKLTAGDTVKLKGLGVNLSGNYYVKSVTRQFSSSGYSNSAVLIKTDMGTSLKTKTTGSSSKSATSKTTSTKSKNTRTYTVKSGDTLKKIAIKFYKHGTSKYVNKIYNANKSKIGKNKKVKKGQKLIIP